MKKILGDKMKSRDVFAVISFRLSVIFNRSRKDLDIDNILQVDNVNKNGYDPKDYDFPHPNNIPPHLHERNI